MAREASHLIVVSRRAQLILAIGIAVIAAPQLASTANAQATGALIIRNNHEIPYTGAIEMHVDLPDGTYRSGTTSAVVSRGMMRTFASLAPRTEIRLARASATTKSPLSNGGFTVRLHAGRLSLQRGATKIGEVDFGLVVIPGTSGAVDSVADHFTSLSIAWTNGTDGILHGAATSNGYNLEVTAAQFAEGALDVGVRLVRSGPRAGPAYLAFVRKVTTPDTRAVRSRFNGRELNGGNSPDIWDRDFWYTRGVDWTTWRAGALTLLSVNGFTPVPTIQRDSAWAEGSHFYVWERTRQHGDTMYLVSEIAGPNAEQAKSRYMPVTPYAPVQQGDTISLKWRLAVDDAPRNDWAESQLRGFAGYRTTAMRGNDEVVSIGVPSVMFGTSYFPYSTFAENFDYYRTPGLNTEGFWPISPVMWADWRKWIPKMRTDLNIVRAMGFESVRLHHLELLQTMKRDEAFAFLDFFTGEARQLGLQILVDTQGPPEWVTELLTRYRDVVKRVELENEVLIDGIKPADPARWTSLYRAAKAADPEAQVFFTGAGNNAMFDRIRMLGVPFDRVGLHLYKHGPQWKEAYSSHVLASAGYASDIGKPITIGEFNWKDLTRMSPEARLGEFTKIYETVLTPHAIPELMEFQFQETLTFNPAVAGSSSRHYEPLYLDRRPKPEAFELMRLIRKYGRDDAPVRELSIGTDEVRLTNDHTTATFAITNNTSRAFTLDIDAIAFDGIRSRLVTPSHVTLAPGRTTRSRVDLELVNEKRVGTYHHFLRVSYAGKKAIGWGVAARTGPPAFSPTPVLGDKVCYQEGAASVSKIDWRRPIAVAFVNYASVLELESAYQLASTLQSATGKKVHLSSEKDIPDYFLRSGILVLVGAPAPVVALASTGMPAGVCTTPGVGTVVVSRQPTRDVLILTGSDAKAVQAAVVDFELRYWPNAKDAAIRVTGMERGAALGNRAGGATVDPP